MGGPDSSEKLTELFSAERIQARVRDLGQEITRDFQHRKVVLVCVLKGAFLFFADLVRAVSLDVEVDFVRLSSYGTETASSGKILFGKDMEIPVAGKDVVIVEDIVDTGRSMVFLKNVLQARNPRSVSICTLVDKHERRIVDVDVEYAGFRLHEGFIVGYGLDFNERFRYLSAICTLEQGAPPSANDSGA